ncbi:MAG: alanine--tRNA ligase-related protein [Planctomycetes bacterium]|nr:alanine--tRNA ligase-related protein [Planctomycetota bacterium]
MTELIEIDGDEIVGVVLDRTAFFPASGGQRADKGALAGFEVTHVREDGEKIVHELAGASGIEIGAQVEGRVNERVRRNHSQQHSGQHILSAAFDRAGLGTVGFHMGEGYCTIDLSGKASAQAIREAFELANDVVREARPVTVELFECAELEAKFAGSRLLVGLDKLPEGHSGKIRLVSVEDFDNCPCCGTHLQKSSEAAPIVFLGEEKVRGTSRISFACGAWALDEVFRRNDILVSAANALGTSIAEVPKIVESKVQSEKALSKKLADAEMKLLDSSVDTWIASAEDVGGLKLVSALCEFSSNKLLNAAAEKTLQKIEGIVFLQNRAEGRTQIVIAKSKTASKDIKAAFDELMKRFSGKGGGRPDFIQGGFAGDVDDSAIFAAGKELLRG